VEAWAPSQDPQGARNAIAQAMGLKKEDVTVNVDAVGRRRIRPEVVPGLRSGSGAVLSKKTGKPVEVVWSREDDIKFDVIHSVAAMYMKAALGAVETPRRGCREPFFPPIGSTFKEGENYSGRRTWSRFLRMCRSRCPAFARKMEPATAHMRIGWLRSVANVYHAFRNSIVCG